MKHDTAHKILLGIFIVCLIISIILTLIPIPVVCDGSNGCEVVQSSSYAKTFGIKNSLIGIPVFAFMSILTFLQIKNHSKKRKWMLNLGIIFGSLVSLYFIFLQISVLKSICKYCMVVDIGLLIALIIILIKDEIPHIE